MQATGTTAEDFSLIQKIIPSNSAMPNLQLATQQKQDRFKIQDIVIRVADTGKQTDQAKQLKCFSQGITKTNYTGN